MARIQSIIQSFDSSQDFGQLAREMLEHLWAFAQTKAETLERDLIEALRTPGSEENKTVPVDAVVASFTDIRAFTPDSAAGIPEAVRQKIKEILNREVDEASVDDVMGRISEALALFLGQTETNTFKQYYIVLESMALIRLDIRAWTVSISTPKLRERVQKVCAFTTTKSLVNIKKLSFNTFLALYSSALLHLPEDVAIKQAQEIYVRFKSLSPDKPAT